MSDVVNFVGMFEAEPSSPYGSGCFRIHGALFVLQKRGSIYFATFTTLRPPYRGQQWTRTMTLAKRFDDSRLAGEYSRYLDSLPDAPPAETLILKLAEENPMPRRAPKVITAEEAMTATEWLTTYTGVRGERR